MGFFLANTKTTLTRSHVIWGLEPCSRARETCRQGCQVRANGAVHASHNTRERDALCMVGHVFEFGFCESNHAKTTLVRDGYGHVLRGW